jgi:hypothetical protein
MQGQDACSDAETTVHRYNRARTVDGLHDSQISMGTLTATDHLQVWVGPCPLAT